MCPTLYRDKTANRSGLCGHPGRLTCPQQSPYSQTQRKFCALKASYRNIPDSLTVRRDPRDADFYTNPYRDYAKWHLDHPVFYWQDYKLWCCCRFEDVNRILRDNRFGRQSPGPRQFQQRDAQGSETEQQDSLTCPHMQDFQRVEQHSLLALDPPEHTRLRKLVNHAFTHRQVQTLLPHIETLAQRLLADIDSAGNSPGTGIDLLRDYATPLAAGVIAKLVGAPESSIPDLLKWSHAMVRVYTLTQTYDEEVSANRAAAEFEALLLALIKQKRTSPGDDLLTSLLQSASPCAQRHPESRPQESLSEPLTDSEIVSIVVLLLNAGHEATVHQIGNAVRLLLTETDHPADFFPDYGQSGNTGSNDDFTARSESAAQVLARNTVLELMRIDTPLHLFKRYALQPVSIDMGNNTTLELETGEEVALLLGAANHDPEVFDAPQKFDPHRKPLDQLSLGAGTHFCVGALLAQHEIRIALQTLFQAKPALRLHQTPEFADTFHFRGLKELVVSW